MTKPFTYLIPLAALALAGAAQAQTYANTEEVYFAGEAGKEAAPRLALRLDGAQVVAVDAFGEPLADAPDYQIVSRDGDEVIAVVDGHRTVLRRARPVTCWASVRKEQAKADGSEDWTFDAGLAMHDQGGRVRAAGSESGAPEVVLRMRRVIWPEGSANRPSLVLYIHSADDPERAVSYSWADFDAARVGINLRWMQASCTVNGAGRAE